MLRGVVMTLLGVAGVLLLVSAYDDPPRESWLHRGPWLLNTFAWLCLAALTWWERRRG